VSALPGGGFVVVWEDASFRIQARRFRSDGSAVDLGDLQVNTDTNGARELPDVAATPDGGFVVAWMTYDGSYSGIHGRRYDASGTPLDPLEFPVNTYTPDFQVAPRVSVAPSGDFIVVWTSFDSPFDQDGYAVHARRFAADGTPRDVEDFLVNTWTTGQQAGYGAEFDAEGNFVVTWFTQSEDPEDDSAVVARRFREDGTAIDAAEFVLSSATTGWQVGPSIARAADGDFVAVWASQYRLGGLDYSRIWRRRFGRPTIQVDGPGLSNGGCSLAGAIESANTGVSVGTCAPGNEGAVLNLPAAGAFTYSSPAEGANALPVIRSSVTVRGNGSRLERDSAASCPAGPNLRLFEVADGGILSLEDVEVVGGCVSTEPGGGVFVDSGTLVMRRSRILDSSGTSGGGVAVEGGNLLVLDSEIRGNGAAFGGGGIYAAGSPGGFRIERSTVAENSAVEGGGFVLSRGGPHFLVQSTVSGNASIWRGGGIMLDSPLARLVLDHVTLFGNDGEDGDALHLAAGETWIHGSILGDDDALDEDTCGADTGVLRASGGNLDDDGSCATIAGVGVGVAGELRLAPLADLGGYAPAHLPLETSLAVDFDFGCRSAWGLPLASDQRGLSRPTDDDGDGIAVCDLGSVERGPLFFDGFESGSTERWSEVQSSSG